MEFGSFGWDFSFADDLFVFYYTPKIGFVFGSVSFLLDLFRGRERRGDPIVFNPLPHVFSFSLSGMFVERAASCSNASLLV